MKEKMKEVSQYSWMKPIFGGLLLLTLGTSVPADSGAIEEKGMIRLVATLKNNPAFTSVVWKVYRLDGHYEQIETIPRHTATLNLKPGNYKAVAMLDNKQRSRSFYLKSNGKAEIVIPMD